MHEYDQVAALLDTWITDLRDTGLKTNTLGILTRTKKQRDEVVRAKVSPFLPVEGVIPSTGGVQV